MIDNYLKELNSAIAVVVKAGHSALALFKQRQPATLADRIAHEIIVGGLLRAFPEYPVVSEEGQVPDVSMGQGRWWLIDPIDGSNYFNNGETCWSVMIALMEHGRPKLGVIYDPVQDRTWYGIVGLGAYYFDTQTLMEVSRTHDLFEINIVVKPRDKYSPWIKRLSNSASIKHVKAQGSVGLRACSVASGESDALLHPDTKLKTWDTAAGEAIVFAAGGECTDVYGGLLNYEQPNAPHANGVVMSNAAIHQQVLNLMNTVIR